MSAETTLLIRGVCNVTALSELFRNAISEGSETGMLVAADALEESDNSQDQSLGGLIRAYVNIQTYVRTSMPIPQELANRYVELQGAFNTKPTRRLEGHSWYGSEYYKPLGIFYIGLRTSLQDIYNNPDLLSTEPIRELEIHDCFAGDALKALLRNYRMGYMQRLTLIFNRRNRQIGQVSDIAQALLGTLGEMLESLTIRGIDDTRKQCQVMFMSAKKIIKGCRLNISRHTYTTDRYDFSIVHR
jgi:hypothetical protein